MATIEKISIGSNNLIINYKGGDKNDGINLSPNRIFADTYGFYSLVSPGFPPLAYNLNGCANYFYYVKILTEHCLDNLKLDTKPVIPANLFQLSGGNLPVQGKNDTYPMRYNGGQPNLKLYKGNNPMSGSVDPYGRNVYVSDLTADNTFETFDEEWGKQNIPSGNKKAQFFASKSITISTPQGSVTRPLIPIKNNVISNNSILLLKQGGAILSSTYTKTNGATPVAFKYSPEWAYEIHNNITNSNFNNLGTFQVIADGNKKYLGSSWYMNFNVGISNYTSEILDPAYKFDIDNIGTTSWSSSQFSTYVFGQNGIGPSLENIDTTFKNLTITKNNFYTEFPKSDINAQIYFSEEQYNEGHSGLTAKDFGDTSLNLWDWEASRYNMLHQCNIKSINWGSNAAYNLAPYSLLASGSYGSNKGMDTQSVYGCNWRLYDMIKDAKKSESATNKILHGGFTDLANTSMNAFKGWNNGIIPNMGDSVATYSHLEGTAPVAEYPAANDTKVSTIIITADDNSNENNVQHPYVALYLLCASGGVPSFWKSIELFKYQVYYLGMTCMMMEDAMANYNSTVKSGNPKRIVAGEICLSPDFGNGFAQLLPTTEGTTAWTTLFGPWNTDLSGNEPSYMKEAISHYANGSNVMYDDLVDLCTEFATNSQWKSFMKKVVTYIKGDEGRPILTKALNYDHNGFRALHAMVGFIANVCGPNVQVGHDIGWTFNPMGNGNWAHHTFGTGTGIGNFDHITVTNLSKSSYLNGNFTNKYTNNQFYKNDTTEMNPIAPALYYLQNVVYGENYNYSLKAPIYSGSGGGGGGGVLTQCPSGHQFLKEQLHLVYGINYTQTNAESITNLVEAGCNGISISFINPANDIYADITPQLSDIRSTSTLFQSSLMKHGKNEGIIYLAIGGNREGSKGWSTAFQNKNNTIQFANDCVKACTGFSNAPSVLFSTSPTYSYPDVYVGGKYPLYHNVTHVNTFTKLSTSSQLEINPIITAWNNVGANKNVVMFDPSLYGKTYDVTQEGYYNYLDAWGDDWSKTPALAGFYYKHSGSIDWTKGTLSSCPMSGTCTPPLIQFKEDDSIIFEVLIDQKYYSYVCFASNALSSSSSTFKMYYGIDLDIELTDGDTTTQNNIVTNFKTFLDVFRDGCPKKEYPLQIDSFSNPTDPDNGSNWMYKGLFKYGPTYSNGFNYLGLMVGGAGTAYLNYWAGSLGVDKATKSEYVPYDCRVCNFYYGTSSYISSIFPKNINQLESFFKYNNINTAVWQWTLSTPLGSGDATSYKQLKDYISNSKFLTDFTIEYKDISTEGQKICNVESLCIQNYNGNDKKLIPTGKDALKDMSISDLKGSDLENNKYFKNGCSSLEGVLEEDFNEIIDVDNTLKDCYSIEYTTNNCPLICNKCK
jgi:hypothetical protein